VLLFCEGLISFSFICSELSALKIIRQSCNPAESTRAKNKLGPEMNLKTCKLEPMSKL
uniref:Uncharacterized protein n=1 Tax=Ursus maritimus TaxID=29073 RepID=A0A452TAL2_URSMA